MQSVTCRNLIRVLPIAVLSFAISGCGGSAPTGPERANVKGTATLDGQPLDGAVITFQNSLGSGGGTVSQGAFEFKGESGIVPGECTVRFSLMKPTGKKIVETDSGQQVDELAEMIPAKYGIQSSERVTVKKGDNEFKFDLKTK